MSEVTFEWADSYDAKVRQIYSREFTLFALNRDVSNGIDLRQLLRLL